MKNSQKEPDGLSPFVPNWLIGTSLLTLATTVGLGVYLQASSMEDQKEATQKQVSEILVQPEK